MQEARAKLHHDMQHFVNEVTAEELDEIIKHMENCAILAHEAGVDCIEVHGDRLVGSLCSPILNHRTDEYGGDLANRTRFVITASAASGVTIRPTTDTGIDTNSLIFLE